MKKATNHVDSTLKSILYKNHFYLVFCRHKKKQTNIGICKKACQNSLKEIPWFLRENICHASFHRQDRFTHEHVLLLCVSLMPSNANTIRKLSVTVTEISFSLFQPWHSVFELRNIFQSRVRVLNNIAAGDCRGNVSKLRIAPEQCFLSVSLARLRKP